MAWGKSMTFHCEGNLTQAMLCAYPEASLPSPHHNIEVAIIDNLNLKGQSAQILGVAILISVVREWMCGHSRLVFFCDPMCDQNRLGSNWRSSNESISELLERFRSKNTIKIGKHCKWRHLKRDQKCMTTSSQDSWGGISTRQNPPKIESSSEQVFFSEQFPLGSWLVWQGRSQKFARTFRKKFV